MLCKNEVPACKRDDLAMFLMCSEAPSEAQFSCIHNKPLAWKRNDLATLLIANLLVAHLFGPGSGHFT